MVLNEEKKDSEEMKTHDDGAGDRLVIWWSMPG